MPKGKCDRCGKNAVIELPYGPHWFCGEHFLRFFEKRVRKTCRANKLIEPGEKILVAYSGGKDSAVTLYLVNKIFGKRNPIQALLIDEGIEGYRDKALDIAEKNCKAWGIPFKRVSFKKEAGFTMVDVMKKTGAKKRLGSTCAFCGVIRRRIMNQFAKKLGAEKLATGHNLDDEAQSALMNLCDADLSRFLRLGPVSGNANIKGLVPRIKPLWESPEIEIIAFAEFNGIDYYREQCCPFKWQAKRNDFRGIVNHLESSYPGTMYSVLSFFRQAKSKIGKRGVKTELGSCSKCGEPCNGKVCNACKQIELIKKK